MYIFKPSFPYKMLAFAALALLVPDNALAQGSSGPDYDNVDDILNGQHSLLQIDDLLVLGQKGDGPVSETQYNTVNSGFGSTSNAFIPGTGQKKAGPAVSANMFRAGGPVLILSFAADNVSNALLVVKSANASKLATANTILAGRSPTPILGLTVADFNEDGLDDVAVETKEGLQVCTARDPNLFDLHLRCGPLLSIVSRIRAVTNGDFSGSGRQMLAVVAQLPDSGIASMQILAVDPGALTINTRYYAPISQELGQIRLLAIASGKFTLAGIPKHDQFAFAYQAATGNVQVATVDFANSSVKPEIRKIVDQGFKTPTLDGLILKRAHLNWFSPYDQLVFLVQAIHSFQQSLFILVVNPDTLAVRRAKGALSFTPGLVDLAIGNFDRNTPGPDGKSQHDPNLQIALVDGRAGSRTSINILNVDPSNDFQLSGVSKSTSENVSTAISVVAADTQGRSIELGPPTKIVINSQGGSSVVAGVPPMHVDYMVPAGEKSAKLLNLSMVKEGFSTSYTMESSSKEQSSRKSTDSYSYGFEEGIEGKVTIGDPEASHLSSGLKFAAQQTFENGVEKQNTNTRTKKFNAEVQTGSSDQVWYDQSRLNIYSYPVVGQLVCPSAKPANCAPADKAPLTIQFSAIDRVTSATAAGSQIEWYQPAWEYGNVLSYPASYSQLSQLYEDVAKLAEGTTFFTDDSKSTVTTTWSHETGKSESVSSARRFAEGGGVSVSGAIAIPIIPVGGIGGAFEFNVSGSQAFENLTTAVTDLGSSSGVTIEKPSDFRKPGDYAYGITPVIFGRTRRPDAVEQPNLKGDIKTAGPIQAAFVADPLIGGSGAWWRAAYSKAPDVALNHPARWVFSSKGEDAACIGESCVSLARKDATNPWLSDFHAMRCFFISDAASPGAGPQLSTAIAGNKLELETRVYNYSLVHMPERSTVQVRFYVQPMSKELAPLGDSKMIGQTEVAPIPPFSDVEGAPLNSVLARTVFDTSNYAGKYLAFWVVIWMQDRNGAMVKEPNGHGLEGIPGDLSSLADVKAEEYSNNLGFYKWLFYVQPRKNAGAADGVSQTAMLAQATFSSATTSTNQAGNRPSSETLPEMQLTNLQVSSGQTAELDQEVDVSASLRAGSGPIPGATVIFYDGNPKGGGRIFDMEHVPYVQANDTLGVEVPFRTETCGPHDLYAVTYQGTEYEKVSEPFVLDVNCATGQK